MGLVAWYVSQDSRSGKKWNMKVDLCGVVVQRGRLDLPFITS